jgi:hypothetical protein
MRSTLKVGVLLVALSVVLPVSTVWAKPDSRKIVPVSRDNFVSLEYETPEGATAFKTQILVRGNLLAIEGTPTLSHLALFSGAGEENRPLPAWLSNNQLDELLRLVNRTRLQLQAGDYSDSNGGGPIREVLTLKYSDAGNRDRVVVIRNRGKAAPTAFFQIVDGLKRLRVEKYPTKASSNSGLFSRESLQTVKFDSLGGFAGIQSSIEIKFPASSEEGKVAIHWINTVDKRGVAQHAELEATEVDELLSLLNAGDLPKLNGKRYRQPNLYDGFNETLTVTLRDGKQYKIENYGDQAPAEYSRISVYIQQLQQKHFPQN